MQTEPRVSRELEEVISLRLRTGPGEGQEVAVAQRFLAKIYRALLTSATTVEKLHHRGQLVGFVMVTAPQPERFGIPEVRLAILCDPNFAEAQTWVAEVLSRLAPQLDPHCTALLDAVDRTLWSHNIILWYANQFRGISNNFVARSFLSVEIFQFTYLFTSPCLPLKT